MIIERNNDLLVFWTGDQGEEVSVNDLEEIVLDKRKVYIRSKSTEIVIEVNSYKSAENLRDWILEVNGQIARGINKRETKNTRDF